MTSLQKHTIAFARLIIILIGCILLAPFFLLSVLGQIGTIYTSAFAGFVAETKALLNSFNK